VSVANPTPGITGLSPASVAAGSSTFTLTVTGTGFVPGAQVQVNGSARTTAPVVAATQLTAAVLATDVASVGTLTVTVVNPAPCVGGTCTSNGQALTVTAP
jgi:hypothetical protein